MSTVIWVVVIVLLLPGLLMIGAVVLRLLVRGFGGGGDAPAPKTIDAEGQPLPQEQAAAGDQASPSSRIA